MKKLFNVDLIADIEYENNDDFACCYNVAIAFDEDDIFIYDGDTTKTSIFLLQELFKRYNLDNYFEKAHITLTFIKSRRKIIRREYLVSYDTIKEGRKTICIME